MKGFPIFGVLTIIFAVAKLMGYFTYSWVWVFAPMIFSVSLGLIILLFVGIIAFIGTTVKN
jgi:hypothetical protein